MNNKKHIYDNSGAKLYDERFRGAGYLEDLELDAIKDLIADNTKNYDSLKILDIGCGTGRIVKIFPHNEYLGVDYTKDFIDFAKRKYKNKKRSFLLAKGEELKQNNKKFDVILFIGTLEDSKNPIKDILRYRKFLKDDGLIVFNVYNSKCYQSIILGFIFRLIAKSYPVTRFSIRDINLLLAGSNLKLVGFKNIWVIGSMSIAKRIYRYTLGRKLIIALEKMSRHNVGMNLYFIVKAKVK